MYKKIHTYTYIYICTVHYSYAYIFIYTVRTLYSILYIVCRYQMSGTNTVYLSTILNVNPVYSLCVDMYVYISRHKDYI